MRESGTQQSPYQEELKKAEEAAQARSPHLPSVSPELVYTVGEPLQAGTVTVLVTAPSGATETVRLAAPGAPQVGKHGRPGTIGRR